MNDKQTCILIATRQHQIIAAARRHVFENDGLCLFTVRTVSEAIQVGTLHRPNVIISDVLLSDGDASDLAHLIGSATTHLMILADNDCTAHKVCADTKSIARTPEAVLTALQAISAQKLQAGCR